MAAEAGNGGYWRGARRTTLPRQGGPIAFGASENRRREAVWDNFRVARHTLRTSRKMLANVSQVILKVLPELRPGPTKLAADEDFVPAGHCAGRNGVAIRHMAG